MKDVVCILQFVFLSMYLSCGGVKDETELSLPVACLSDGDIVFRRGIGLMSRMVSGIDVDGVYSHVGILKRIDDEWYVVHAVPGEPEYEGDVDRVKVELLSRFFAPDRAKRGMIMRWTGDSLVMKEAAIQALQIAQRGTLFDHHYNLDDTTEMYCTELVCFVSRKVGVDLSEGRMTSVNLPGVSGDYLLPSDLSSNKQLKVIYKFSR